MKLISFIGAPGSGKGTQAKLLSKSLKYVHFSTGEVLRNETSSGTSFGKSIKRIISLGNLISDRIMFKVVSKFVISNINKKGIILDGFPRTLKQAKMLDRFSKKRNIEIKVVYLKINDSEVMKRLKKRSILEKRNDDTSSVIANRVKLFKVGFNKLIDFYNIKTCLIEVNGLGDEYKINKEILKSLKVKKL